MPKGKKAKKNGKQQKEKTGGRRSGQDITHGSSLTHDSMRDNGKPGKRGREGEGDGRRTIAREGDNNVRVVPRGGRRKGNATIRKKRAAQGGAGPAKAPAHRKINERGHARQWTMALFRAGGHLFFVVSLPRPQSQTLPSECAVSALPASHSQSFLFVRGGERRLPKLGWSGRSLALFFLLVLFFEALVASDVTDSCRDARERCGLLFQKSKVDKRRPVGRPPDNGFSQAHIGNRQK